MPLVRAEFRRSHQLLKPRLLHDVSQVAYWPFDWDNGSFARDRSGHANHGIIYGASRAAGKNGSALSFDGVDDTVAVPANPILRPPRDFSFAAWAKARSLSAWAGILTEIEDVTFGGANLQIGTFKNIAFFVGDGARGYTYVGTEWVPSVNVWYFIVGVHKGDNNILYVNGVKEAEAIRSVSFSVQNVYLGRFYTNRGGSYFDGVIDEVRIFNRALSQAEIQRLMNMRGV